MNPKSADTATDDELRALYRPMRSVDLELLRRAFLQDGTDTEDIDAMAFVVRRILLIDAELQERER